jgi:hypothetical protein
MVNRTGLVSCCLTAGLIISIGGTIVSSSRLLVGFLGNMQLPLGITTKLSNLDFPIESANGTKRI